MNLRHGLIFLSLLTALVTALPGCKDNPEAPEPFVIWVTPADTTVEVGEIVPFVVHHTGEWPKYSQVVYDFGDGTTPGKTSGTERQYAFNLPSKYDIHIRVTDHQDGTEYGAATARVNVKGSSGILLFTQDTVYGTQHSVVDLMAIYTGPPVFVNALNCPGGEYRWDIPDRENAEFLWMHSDTAVYRWQPWHDIYDKVTVSLVARGKVLCSDTCVVMIQ